LPTIVKWVIMRAEQGDMHGGAMTTESAVSLCCSSAVKLDLVRVSANLAKPGSTQQNSEQAVRQALRAARIGILDVRLPGGRGHFSQECLQVLGYDEEDASAFLSGWLPLVHPQDLPVYRDNRRRVSSGETNRFEEEVRRMRRDGSYGWVRMVGEVVERDAQGAPARLVATLEDVDARYRAEAELRAAQKQILALSAHVEARLEAERKLIASEVHDQCGQLLTVLKLEVSALRGTVAPDGSQAACLKRLDASVDELVGMSRDLIARLRPPALDLGLVPALEWLAGQWTRKTGMACEFSCALDDLILPDEQATALFRLVQESLTNATRHARATWVHIRLGVRQGELDLRVADNGCGFDPAADHAGHYGLLGMRERALRMGARLELNSRPSAGTEVRVAMPLPAVAA